MSRSTPGDVPVRKPPSRRRVRLDWAPLEDRKVPTTLVALIDSGVDLTSAADAPYYDFTTAYDSYDKVAINASNHGYIQDTSLQHGHGSTVADFIVDGIVDADSQLGSAAPAVKIMPIRDTAANALQPDDSALIRGVYWAADHGAAVINLSLRRFNGDFVSDTDPTDPHYGTTLSQAIQYAQSLGAIVVTSSGNEAVNVDGPNPYGTFIMPGGAASAAHNGLGVSLNNVLVTAAVDGSNKLTQYSNWGPTTVNIGAPTGSGSNAVTSYSTGYASGVSGVIAALTPGYSASQRISLIDSTATPAPQAVGSWSTTGDVINPSGAVRQAQTLFPPQPVTMAATSPILLAAGSSAGVVAGGFVGDPAFVSGGNLTSTGATVNTGGVVNPPPSAVYQTERWTYGTMVYTIPNLKPGAGYDIRLDFAETWYTQAGQRSFNVAINGSQVLSSFDILAAAGGPLRAVAESFDEVAADPTGKITISFTNLVGGAKVNAIEVVPTRSVAVVAGSSASAGPFAGDATIATGGSTYATGQAIDTSGVVNPAPQAVYQSERWDYAGFTETIPGLVPGSSYAVRLDFSENYFNGPGQRTFDVLLNGQKVLAGFDIFQAAGGKYRAVARTFTAVADASGKITLVFTNTTPGNSPGHGQGGAKVDGIEITPTGGASASLSAGASITSGSFATDGATATGGSTYATGQAIDTSGVVNPAPQAVYQSERWDYAGFTETIPGLVPGSSYAVRLDFSENYFNGPGQRTFNVTINGALALSGFDIFQAAGGQFKAIARTFNAVADASGRITLVFTNTTPGNSPSTPRGGAKVDGIEATPAQATPVELSGLYNVVGITTDANPGIGNLDGSGSSYSSTLLGPVVTSNGVAFNIGPAGANDAVIASGQTVVPPSGNFRGLQILATGVNGAHTGTFVVNYTDGSTSTTIRQTLDDWHSGPSALGEAAAVSMSYRNRGGGRDNLAFDLYSYSVGIDPTKTIASITLPTDPNIAIFAIDLVP